MWNPKLGHISKNCHIEIWNSDFYMQLWESEIHCEIPWPPWVLRRLQAVMWVCRENIHAL